MDKNMQRITRQIISFAQGDENDFNYNTISDAINSINEGVKIQPNYKKAALNYLVENDFLVVTDGNYKIQPKLNYFTTWAAYNKKVINR
jgi:hypothetical protein